MLKRWFGKKEEGNAKEINDALLRIDRDVYLIQQWISHLHGKSEEMKNSHFQHVEITRKDISQIQKWMQYLHAHNAEMHRFVRETTRNILELKKSGAEMAQRLEKIEQGQVGTLEGTNQGQIKDMSIINNMNNIPVINKKPDEKQGRQIIVEKEDILQKHEFAGSEIELLNVLYHADRPLSYEEIAKITGKKEKSIRNLIYELREKNIGIKSKPVGIRKKGFFLEREEKIRISGR